MTSSTTKINTWHCSVKKIYKLAFRKASFWWLLSWQTNLIFVVPLGTSLWARSHPHYLGKGFFKISRLAVTQADKPAVNVTFTMDARSGRERYDRGPRSRARDSPDDIHHSKRSRSSRSRSRSPRRRRRYSSSSSRSRSRSPIRSKDRSYSRHGSEGRHRDTVAERHSAPKSSDSRHGEIFDVLYGMRRKVVWKVLNALKEKHGMRLGENIHEEWQTYYMPILNMTAGNKEQLWPKDMSVSSVFPFPGFACRWLLSSFSDFHPYLTDFFNGSPIHATERRYMSINTGANHSSKLPHAYRYIEFLEKKPQRKHLPTRHALYWQVAE